MPANHERVRPNAISAVIATLVPPKCPAQILRGAERIVPGDGASGACSHGWVFLRGGLTAADPGLASLVHVDIHCEAVDRIVAFARVVCPVCCDAAELLITGV